MSLCGGGRAEQRALGGKLDADFLCTSFLHTHTHSTPNAKEMDALKDILGKELEKQAGKVLGDVLGKVTGGKVQMPGALSEVKPILYPLHQRVGGRESPMHSISPT